MKVRIICRLKNTKTSQINKMTEMLLIVLIAIGSIALIVRRILKAKRYREQVQSTSGWVRVIYNTQVVELVNHIKTLPPTEYGNKWEIAAVLAEGVRNGRDPAIRQAQINLAARAKANSHELHTYSSDWYF